MNDNFAKLDDFDLAILDALQRDGSLPQRELAARVGLSQNACWRRLQRLNDSGLLRGTRAVVDAGKAGLHLTVFVMLRTRHHDIQWASRFRARVEAMPEITEFHRIGGEWDYMVKIVTTSMAGYDKAYKTLIDGMDLEQVTGYFSMETILQDRPLRIAR